jgi:hypothetical protein
MRNFEANYDQCFALAFTLGVHAVVLVLAIACSPRYAMKPAGDEGSSLEIVAIDVPSSSRRKIMLAPHQRTAERQSASQKFAAENPTNKQSAGPVAEQQRASDSDSPDDPRQTTADSAQRSKTSNASQLAQRQTSQPASDTSDPLAELRRLRAEAEHQRQLDGFALKQAQDEQARYVVAQVVSGSGMPMQMLASSREETSWVDDPHPAALSIAASGELTFRNGLPSSPCLAQAFGRRKEDARATDWIDCLLDSAVYDVATRSTHDLRLIFMPVVASASLEEQRHWMNNFAVEKRFPPSGE